MALGNEAFVLGLAPEVKLDAFRVQGCVLPCRGSREESVGGHFLEAALSFWTSGSTCRRILEGARGGTRGDHRVMLVEAKMMQRTKVSRTQK